MVRIEICRTVGGLHSGDGARICVHRLDASRDVVGEAELDGLGAVGDRAAAQGDDQVGLGLRAPAAAAITADARRSAAGILSKVPTQWLPQRAAQLVDLVGLRG